MRANDAGEHTESTPRSSVSRRWIKAASYLVGATAFLLLLNFGCHEMRKSSQLARAASCANDTAVLFYHLKQYTVARDGIVPPISSIRGNIMMDADGFYPDYLDNSCWVQCEISPTRLWGGAQYKNNDLGVFAFNDDSFCYLPWEIRNEKEGLAFIEAYKNLDLAQRHEDLVIEIDGQSVVLPRIRLSTDSPRVPIIVEWPNHAHLWGNVFFADGSAEKWDIGDGFPMTEKFIAGLREIASIDKPIPAWEPW